MSKIVKIISNYWPQMLLALSAFMFLLPFLSHPVFNLIDDGLNLQVGQRFVSNPSTEVLSQVLVKDELALGRMRPCYFLFYVLLYLVIGDSARGFWLTQALLLSTTLLLTYFLLFTQSKNRLLATAGTLTLLMMPSFAENYFRLGTAETKQVIPMLLLMIWLMRMEKRNTFTWWENLIAAVCFTVPLFIKETAIVMFGWLLVQFAVHWLKRQWRMPGSWSLFITIICIVVGFFAVLPGGNGYSSNYVVSVASIKESILVLRIVKAETVWLVLCLIGLFSVRFVNSLVLATNGLKRLVEIIYEERWHLSYIAVTIGALLVLLPWKYKLERYFYFIDIMLTVSLTTELMKSYLHWKPQLAGTFKLSNGMTRNPLIWLCTSAIMLFFLTKLIFPTTPLKFHKWPKMTWDNFKIWYTQYQYSGAITTYLQTSIPEKATVLIDYDDYEVIYELGIFASGFGERDIVVVSPNPQVEHDFGGIYTTHRDLRSYPSTPASPVYLISRGPARSDTAGLHENILWPHDSRVARDHKVVWRVYQ